MDREERELKWKQYFLLSQKGDKSAYKLLLTEIDRFSKIHLKKIHRNEEQIEDIAQEILVAIHKARHTYDPKRPFMPWVIAIIHFKSSDYLRYHYRHKRRLQELEDIATFREEATNTDKDAQLDVDRLLKCLDPRQEQILRLLKIEGWSVREVSEKVGLSEANVKVIAHRSLKHIKALHQEV